MNFRKAVVLSGNFFIFCIWGRTMKGKGERAMKKRLHGVNSWTFACMAGLAASVMMIVLSLLGAKLLEGGVVQMKAINILSMIILGLSSIFGTLLTLLSGKEKILLRCLLTATVLFLSVAILSGVLQKGGFYRIGETALVIYASSAAVGLLCAGKKRRYR